MLFASDENGFHIRDDISDTTEDYECFWTEVHTCNTAHNMICAVVYRHPQSNFDNFTNYFTFYIDKVSSESNLLYNLRPVQHYAKTFVGRK